MNENRNVRVGSLDVSYRERGEGGRSFVLVHGFTGSSLDWIDVLEPLGRHGHTLAPDNRGHGDTTNPGSGYDLATLRADLLGFLDALGIERCDLLGHSLGGAITQRFALEHAERVASLVLMDTTPRPIGRLDAAVMEAMAKLGREQGMSVVLEGFRNSPGGAVVPGGPVARTIERLGADEYWGRIERKWRALDPEALPGCSRSLETAEPLNDRLGEIACPTTVLVGEHDEPFRAPSEELAAGIPDAELVVVPGAGHSPQLENEPAWLDAIGAHLERVRR